MSLSLNTLFVTTEGAWVHKDHETVVVKVKDEKVLQVPMLHLSSIVCLARVNVSPELMAALAEAGIQVAYFTPEGRFLARVEGAGGGSVLLRRAQFRAADDVARSLAIARAIVAGKIANTRQVLLHARRDAAPDRLEPLEHAAARLNLHLQELSGATTVDGVRGTEGIAARDYFGVFGLLIKRDEPELSFAGRSRRPPRDRVNCLMSFLYTLLFSDCSGAAAGVGLDPAVGYLHEDRPGRLSLALDLMEELRAPVADRVCLSLLNRRQLGPDDFKDQGAGAWRMTDAARKTVLTEYQQAKRDELHHPLLDEQTTWGRIPHLQALLLARHLRGDLEVYPPLLIH